MLHRKGYIVSRSVLTVLSFMVVFAFMAIVPTYVNAADINFTFNAPDKTVYILTEKLTRQITIENIGSSIENTEFKVRVTLTKNDTGYEQREEFLSYKNNLNGKEQKNLMYEAMYGSILVSELDKSGHMTDIKGHEDVRKKLEKVYPITILDQIFNVEKLNVRYKEEWYEETGSFVGKSASFGDVWLFIDTELMTPTDSSLYFKAIKFTDKTKMAGHNCVQLDFKFTTSPAEIRNFAGTRYDGLLDQINANLDKIKATNMEVSGGGSVVFDPVTMLTYYYIKEKNTNYQLRNSKGTKFNYTVNEKREYNFEYQ